MNDGALLIDIRPVEQRRRDGAIPGAQVVSRNVLEWRLDPTCEDRNPELARTDCPVILICNEGYQSSLAAATLCDFGLDATDVIGGAQEWIRSGLPTEGRHRLIAAPSARRTEKAVVPDEEKQRAPRPKLANKAE